MKEFTVSDQVKVARNEAVETFTLTSHDGESRVFELKHLRYDDYLEFCELASPIIAELMGGLKPADINGEFKIDFNPLALDFQKLFKLAGRELPRMAWLICKQTEPKITIDKVKELGDRWQNLLLMVLKQIQHNAMIKELTDFLPLVVGQMTALVEAHQPEKAATTTPSE